MKPNILLLVADCLRQDKLGLMADTLAEMPNKVTFSNAWSTGNASDNNFASILTGCHPDIHGVMTQDMDTTRPTLPEALSEAGYDIFGASVNYDSVGLPSFYRRGFRDWCRLGWGKTFDWKPVLYRILKLQKPWFAMLRPMSLHEPSGSGKKYDYDDRIRNLGGCCGDLLRGLPESVVILTADHGQGNGERGRWDHREGLHEFLTHVPLVFSGPDFQSQECGRFFQHMDLTETTSSLAGASFWTQGIDWSDYLRGGEKPAVERDEVIQFAFGSESGAVTKDRSELWVNRAIRTDNWAYLESRRGDEVKRELYDRIRNPRELNVPSNEDTMARLANMMGWPEVGPYDENTVLERLKALGYA